MLRGTRCQLVRGGVHFGQRGCGLWQPVDLAGLALGPPSQQAPSEHAEAPFEAGVAGASPAVVCYRLDRALAVLMGVSGRVGVFSP